MTSSYDRAIELGFTEEQIAEHLSKKDPSFSQKFERAKQLGYQPREIFEKASVSAPKNPDKETPQKPKEFEAIDYAKDVAKQGVQGIGIGALSTYGDLFQMLGLQTDETLPGEKNKYKRESDILGEIQGGKVPSIGELMELSDDDVLPRYSRLPTTQDTERFGKERGIVTEAETAAGRFAKRAGKIGTGMALTGPTNLKTPLLAGAAGQAVEEAGGPPWMQAFAEIATSLKTLPTSSKNITSKTPEIEQTIQNLRKAGYSEKDITLAKSALEERKLLKKYASLTPEAENSINQGLKNSESLLQEQIKKGLPGYAEGGLPYLEKQASNVYSSMEDLASTIPVKNTEPVKKAIQNSIDYLEKYPLLKEQKEFIEFLKDGLKKSDNANTAEFFTGFYRNLNKAGQWGNPKQKEHLLGIVKKGIKETFDQSGPEAKKFGEYFDKTNTAWKKWLDARDLMGTIEKAQKVEGVDFKKLTSILNDPENADLARKVLGPEQLKNIDSINKGAVAIDSLLKQIPKSDKSIQSLKYLEGIRSLMTGDYKPLAAIIGMESAKRMATNLLIDPSKQNRMIKIINAAKNKSPQQAMILSKELIENELSKKHSSPAKEEVKKPR